ELTMCIFFLVLLRLGPPPALHSFPTRRSSDLLPGAAWAASLVLRSDMACVPESCEGWRNQRTGNAQSSPLVSFLAGFGRHDTSGDRKSTRLNSSHQIISYAVFCLKKKIQTDIC